MRCVQRNKSRQRAMLASTLPAHDTSQEKTSSKLYLSVEARSQALKRSLKKIES
jgi:hypothetical protein